MPSPFNDVRQAFRIIRSNPGLSIISILMLALGIGACTAIFTVVNAVLLRPLPYVEPNGLARLFEVSEKGGRMNVPEANFVDWKSGSRSFESMAIYGRSNVYPIIAGNEVIRARVTVVGDGFFNIFKIEPLIGVFSKDGVAVSYTFWKRALGGRDIQEAKIRMSDQTTQVSAVMPEGFSFPADSDVWVPRGPQIPFYPSRSAHNWSVVARLRPGLDAVTASRELGAIAKNIHAQYTDVTAVDAVAIPLQEQLTQSVSVVLPVLLAAVGILLLVACANVTNLLLAHVNGRSRELAVRTSLGANWSDIASLFLAQSLTLTAIGGFLGILVSKGAVDGLLAMSDRTLPRIDEVRPDPWVLSFAILLSLAVGVVLGLIPAFRASRMNLDETLKQGGRSEMQGSANRTARNVLVIAQVAMTMVLLVGAGLLGRTFIQLLKVNLGFQTQNRIAVELLRLQGPSSDASQRVALQTRFAQQTEQLLSAISSLPGVTAVGGIDAMPLAGGGGNGRFVIEGGRDSGPYWPNYRVASTGYFEAMGIPLVRGRFFNSNDAASTPEVVVISQDVANKVWPGEDPIGKRINYGNMDGDLTFMTIVGVVGDVRNTPESGNQGEIYVNYLQRGSSGAFTVVVKSATPPEALVPSITSQIRSISPETAVRVLTLEQMFSSNLANRRFNFVLLTLFGGAALTLALIGIYGVTAYSVAQRKQEIGIRIALGAKPSDVSGLFVGESARLVMIGIGIGVAGSIALTRALSSLLFNVPVNDVASYLVAIVPLFAAAMLASHLPARRAARVDPMLTIRNDITL